MADQNTIREITIEKAPGFSYGRFPAVKKFSSKLNVVWGPNGSGKTTLASALFSLIWKQKRKEKLEVQGLLESSTETWRLQVRGRDLSQIRLSDNVQIPLPGRNDEMSGMYWFSLSDFLSGADDRADFHTRVYQQMQGGVDIARAAESSGAVSSFSTGGTKIVKTANDANKSYQEAKKLQSEVSTLSSQIKEKEKELASLEKVGKDLSTYEKVQELKGLEKEVADALKKADEFPSQIFHVTTYSYTRYEQLEGELQKKRADLTSLEEDIEDLESSIARNKVSSEQLEDPAFCSYLQELVTDLEQKKREEKDCADKVQEAEGKLHTWEAEHRWLVDTLPGEEQLAASIDQLKQFSSDFEPLRGNLAASEKYRDFFGSPEEFDETDELLSKLKTRTNDLTDALITSRSIPEEIGFPEKTKKQLSLLSAGISVASLILSFAVHPLFALLTLIIPLLFWWGLGMQGKQEEATQALQHLKAVQEQVNELLGRLAWPVIEEIEPDNLSELLSKIETRLALNKDIERKNAERKTAEEKYTQALESMQNRFIEWKDACSDIGLDPENPRLDGAQFFHFATHLKTWLEYLAAKDAAQEAYSLAKGALESTVFKLKEFLGTETDDPLTLVAHAKSLDERVKKVHSLQEELEKIKRKLGKAREDHEEAEQTLTDFWEVVQINPPDEHLLKSLSDSRKAWDTLQHDMEYDRGKIKDIHDTYPVTVEHSEKADEEIELIIEDLKKHLENRSAVNNELIELKSTYKTLTEGSSLAEAERDYLKALQELESFRQEQVLGRVIDMIAKKIEAESQSASVPEVLLQASTWLERITAGRYQLRANKESFYAFDTVHMENLSLEELSDGTRIQLLFAVRMGFITVQEMVSGKHMPIFMDELLANSDDKRALEIIDAVKEIAENRQVFYFTAQADEVEKFREHAEEVLSELDLAKHFGAAQADRNPLIPHLVSLEKVPEPMADYTEYGKTLSVSAQSLWNHIEELHSWYLFTDSAELFHYLEDGRVQTGQLDASDAMISRRRELLKEAQQLAQIGRCRPLYLSDLKEADISLTNNKSAEYWKQIEEVLAASGGDGEDLVAALDDTRVKRVGGQKKQELLDWLLERGYTSEEEKKDTEEIMGILLSRDPELSLRSDDYLITERYLKQVLREG